MRRRQVATFALICAAWLVQAGGAQALPDGSDRQGLPQIPPSDPVSTWAVATTNTCVGQVGTAAASVTVPTLPTITLGTCPSQVVAGASAALAEPGWALNAARPTVTNVENTADSALI